MNAELARELTTKSIAILAEHLAQGRSDTLKDYLAMQGRFHRYSFGNIVLIYSQRPEASRVAGFNAWKKLGRFVKKGERAITVIAPMLIKAKAEHDAEPAEGRPAKPIMRFKAVNVFDVSQTDGDPLPEPVRVGGEPGPYLDRLIAEITRSGISLEEQTLAPDHSGYATKDKIVIQAGMPPAERFSVLVHELAHTRLHFGCEKASKTVRETEAEAVAFVVAQAIGLDTGTAASDYISLYQGDAKTLADSLDTIQKTAAAIIHAIQPQHEAETVEA